MAVVHAHFPVRQVIARPTAMAIVVRNTGSTTVPNVAVTVDSFNYVSSYPNLAANKRPIWAVERGPGRDREPARGERGGGEAGERRHRLRQHVGARRAPAALLAPVRLARDAAEARGARRALPRRRGRGGQGESRSAARRARARDVRRPRRGSAAERPTSTRTRAKSRRARGRRRQTPSASSPPHAPARRLAVCPNVGPRLSPGGDVVRLCSHYDCVSHCPRRSPLTPPFSRRIRPSSCPGPASRTSPPPSGVPTEQRSARSTSPCRATRCSARTCSPPRCSASGSRSTSTRRCSARSPAARRSTPRSRTRWRWR